MENIKRRRRAHLRSNELVTNSRNHDFVSLIHNPIRTTGLLPDQTERSIVVLVNMATVCYFIINVSQFIKIIQLKNDMDAFFESFSVFSFSIMGVFKLFMIRCQKKRWSNILSDISILENKQLSGENDPLNREYETDDEQDEFNFPNYIHNYTNRSKFIINFLKRVYYTSFTIFALIPFIEYTLWKLELRWDEYIGYPHSIPGWTPLDDVHVLCYVVTIVIEVIGSIYSIRIHIAYDTMVVGLMIFLNGQFSLLHDYCELIGGHGKLCYLSIERDDRAHHRIIRCYRTHIQLVNIVKELDKLLRNTLGVYFLVTIFTLCAVAIRLMSVKQNIVQLLFLFQYMVAALTQLFLFCYYGDAVLNKSSVGPGEGPFAAAWWCLSPRIRKELLLLSFGMCAEQRLHAGPFNSLDLPSFAQILRAAYSYTAILQQIE